VEEVMNMSEITPLNEKCTDYRSSSTETRVIRGKVLTILSSARSVELKDDSWSPVGYHLSELIELHKALTQAGYQLIFATPDGNTPIPDPAGLAVMDPELRLEYELYLDNIIDLMMPYKFSQISEEMLYNLSGLLIPGGRAALTDLPGQKDLKRILRHMQAHMKPIVAIGHGVAGLLQPPEAGETWLFYDYEMTCYPRPLEERYCKRHTLILPKLELNGALDELGAELRFHHHLTREFIVEFKELLTGQNSASAKTLAKLAICHLNKNHR
jgi:putative intracellular protease/amidase